jgi:hypothetical protein
MVPFDLRESMSIAVAAKLSGKAGNTIRLWAERHGIGRKMGDDWHISRRAVRIFLDGDMAALAAYHAGDRTNPLVRPYFERAGCGVLLLRSMGGTIGIRWVYWRDYSRSLFRSVGGTCMNTASACRRRFPRCNGFGYNLNSSQCAIDFTLHTLNF